MAAVASESQTRAVFARYDWDYEQYQQTLGSFDRLNVLNGEGGGEPDQIEAIHVLKWERFGNSVVQLRNLGALCAKYKIPVMYYEREHEFFDVSRLTATTGVPVVQKTRKELAPQNGVILSARFFFDKPFRLFPAGGKQAAIDTHVLPLLPPEFSAGHPLVTDSSVTAHFRAGDIFASIPLKPGASVGYGQPPLEYYKRAVDMSDAKRVIVAFEDMNNPTIQPFMDYVVSTGRELVTQSSTLKDDLTLLFNSRELISGRGSFLYTMHALGQHLQRFWFFEWLFDNGPLERKHIQVVRIFDGNGAFRQRILSNNWQNSEEQRAFMLAYPADSLAVKVVSG